MFRTAYFEKLVVLVGLSFCGASAESAPFDRAPTERTQAPVQQAHAHQPMAPRQTAMQTNATQPAAENWIRPYDALSGSAGAGSAGQACSLPHASSMPGGVAYDPRIAPYAGHQGHLRSQTFRWGWFGAEHFYPQVHWHRGYNGDHVRWAEMRRY